MAAESTLLSDAVAVGVGLVAAAVLASVLLALLLSVPVVGVRAAQVLLRREWIPLVYNWRSLARRKLMTLATSFVLTPDRHRQGVGRPLRRRPAGRHDELCRARLASRRHPGSRRHGARLRDLGDIEVMAPVFRRGYCSATLVLKDAATFSALPAALSGNATLSDYVVRREVDYWRALSDDYVGFVRLLGGVVTVIFSFGAILGALNTMYAQVSARTREIGTLRAIGFKPRAILISVIGESVLLALAAGVLGILCASLLERRTFELTTVQTLSEITYGFHLSPELALACLGFAALMGYAGGLLPALRAARMPIVDAVRAS